MKYQKGKVGRIIVARFEDREDILGNVSEIAKKENIRNAVVYLIGGVKQGRIVVGPEQEELPPKPIWREIKESHEVLAMGTIFCHEDEPKIHLHGTFGKRDTVHVGCLRETSETFLVLEMILLEIEGIDAQRAYDETSGLTLLKL